MGAQSIASALVAGVFLGISTISSAADGIRVIPRTYVLPVWEGLTELDCRVAFREMFERLDDQASSDPDFRDPKIAMSCFTYPKDRGGEAGQFYKRVINDAGWQAITAHLTITYFGRDDEFLGIGFVPEWPHPASLGSLVIFTSGGKDSNLAGAVDSMKRHFGDFRQTQEQGAQPGPIPDNKGEIKKPD